jgi:hypothetical protein
MCRRCGRSCCLVSRGHARSPPNCGFSDTIDAWQNHVCVMTWYPDFGSAKFIVPWGDHFRTIGWLHPQHSYARGSAPTEFLIKLKAFAQLSRASADALCWPYVMGFHDCEFCNEATAGGYFGVPAGDELFVAPEMMAHYVEQHEYLPAAEFIEAVLASPLPNTSEYLRSVERFRPI